MKTSNKIKTATGRHPVTRTTAMILLTVAAAAMAGCWPRQLVVWSPDGNRAVVMDANTTSLCDGEGKLAPLDVGPTQAATWMDDSRHVLLAVQKSAGKWADLADALNAPGRAKVIMAATDLENAVTSLPAGREITDKDMQEIAKKVFEGRTDLLPAVLVYLRDKRPEALRKRLGEKWRELDEKPMSVAYTSFAIYELDGMKLRPARTVLNSLQAVIQMRLSPNGKTIAYVTTSTQEKDGFSLWLCPLSAKAEPVQVADGVALYPDWSADGRYVVYVQSTAVDQKNSLALGTLSRRRVADEAGNLLDKLPRAEDLAGMLFAITLEAQCMRDGRILFSAADVTLPTTTANMPERASLFAFDPDRPATLTRMVPKQTEGELPVQMLFSLSPDQKQVSITGDHGKVCVVSLADGKLTWVQEKKGKLRILPSWRKPGELCLGVPAGAADGRPEVAIWSDGKIKVISKDWPDEVLKNMSFSPAPKKRPPGKPGPNEKP